MRSLMIVMIVLLSFQWAHTQIKEEPLTRTKRSLLPVVFFLPETSLGFGAMVVSTMEFMKHEEETRPSQFIFSNAYTLRRQFLLFAPYEFYSNGNRDRIKGELGYYRYFYNYFGVGRRSSAEDLETYNVNFPRIDVNYSRRVHSNLYLGLGFNFDAYNITEIDEGGRLMLDSPTGVQGGNKSNLYALAAYDTRDNINAPSSGFYLESSLQRSFSPISDFSYTKWVMDLRSYSKFREKLIVASQILIATASEGAPFFDLPYLSSPVLGRGLNDRRYLTNRLVAAQNEYRFPIKKRFHGAAFISANFVLDDAWDFSQEDALVVTYGVGVRYEIQPESRTRLRLDIASAEGGFNFYFTVNEAF